MTFELLFKGGIYDCVFRPISNISRIHLHMDLQLPMQPVHITTKRCDFESCSGEVYSIQHYVIKVVSDLRWVLWFPPSIKLTATI
jgi:hypothetical protein